MPIVIALGGNALLQRGQVLNAENQRDNIRVAARQLARVHENHKLVIAHGNGPQVGLLALMDQAYHPVDPYPLDVLGAETVGMIGYMIEQELGNIIPDEDHIVTVLTQVVVDPKDPAFQNPTKPVGPVYERDEAERLNREKGWAIAPDGPYYRRVVASPEPQRIIEIDAIRLLVDEGIVVICAGGGGIPGGRGPVRGWSGHALLAGRPGLRAGAGLGGPPAAPPGRSLRPPSRRPCRTLPPGR